MKIIKKFINLFKDMNSKEERHMKLFSDEHLDKLTAEHKMCTAVINNITGSDFAHLSRTHTAATVHRAIDHYKFERFRLECEIDVLTEHLRG